ncbi:MAG: hypothetical protein ACLFV4_00800 [Candidatus Hydrogenedentota bacterium]
MTALTRAHQTFAWILLVMVGSVFAFVAYNWLSYCSPTEAARFAFSGAWFKEEFWRGSAGFVLDQPAIGKFFLWTSVMSCLACTIVLLLRTAVDTGHRVARRWVNVGTTLLLALVLIELLAPTFLLVQYVISMGMTIRRFLGLCLCGGFWILLPSVVFWTWKANPTATKWVRNPLAWAWVCSLVAPAYTLSLMLHLSAWRQWSTLANLLAWVVLVAPGLYAMWLIRPGRRRDTEQRREEYLPRGKGKRE